MYKNREKGRQREEIMTAAVSLKNQRSNAALVIVYYIISLRDIEMNKGIGGERGQELSEGEML